MQEAPSPSSQETTETLNIEQNNKKFILLIKNQGENMTLIVSIPEEFGNPNYIKKLTLKEIKEKETNNMFLGLKSCVEFSNYLKALVERKKLSINKKDDNLSLNLNVEYLFNNYTIEFILCPEKKNSDEIIRDLCREVNCLKEKKKKLENNADENVKNENKQLKIEIQNLNKEIKSLKEEIKEIRKIIEPIDKKYKMNNIFGGKSVIMKENEYDLIRLAIKSRMNREIKEMKKLYQATIDGDGSINFHSKCDNIPNTLVIIKSAGNRRFGGFTSQTWKSNSNGWVDDKNAFLFSLDKQKIYSYKNDNYAIFNYTNYGPTFGNGYCIYIGSNCIQTKSSYTNESNQSCSYNFNGDNNALSEDGKCSHFYAVEYEVFQIIFE